MDNLTILLSFLKPYIKKSLQLGGSYYVWKILRYAVSPDANTSQTILTFWSSVLPSEYPLQFTLLHILLLLKGYYSDAPRQILARRSPSGRTDLVQRTMDTASFLVALGALVPLLRLLRNQLTSGTVYRDCLTRTGIVPVYSNRSLSMIKYLACLIPLPMWLNRNIRIFQGITYGTAPAEVTVDEALKDAASLYYSPHYPPNHNHQPNESPSTFSSVSADTGSSFSSHTFSSSSPSASNVISTDADNNSLSSISFRKLKLDIYVHKNRQTKPKAPIFAYIHGGGWVVGDKQFHSIPLLMEIARAGWLVVTINYRLAGGGNLPPYPYALYDCKRAIAWLRENAGTYGGDGSFILVGGESAGGQLALMLGLTPNIPSLQKEGNIQHINTQVEGVLDLYGATDWTDSEHQWKNKGSKIRPFIEKLVLKRKYVDHTHEFVRGSPLYWVYGSTLPFELQRRGIYIRRPEEISWIPAGTVSNDSSSSKKNSNTTSLSSLSTTNSSHEESVIVSGNPTENRITYSNPSVIATDPQHISPLIADMCVDRTVPPVMIIHGDIDTLVPIEDSRIFYKALQERRVRDQQATIVGNKPTMSLPKDVYIEVPGAHHAYNFMMSPRTLALGNAVIDWINHVHTVTMAQRNQRSKL